MNRGFLLLLLKREFYVYTEARKTYLIHFYPVVPR